MSVSLTPSALMHLLAGMKSVLTHATVQSMPTAQRLITEASVSAGRVMKVTRMAEFVCQVSEKITSCIYEIAISNIFFFVSPR